MCDCSDIFECIIIRQMENCAPVVTTTLRKPEKVFKEKDACGFTLDIEEYFQNESKEYIKEFVDTFPEFADAKWYYTIQNKVTILYRGEITKTN